MLLTFYCYSVPIYTNYQHCVYNIFLMILRQCFGSRFRNFKRTTKSVYLGTSLQRNSVFKMVEYINIEDQVLKMYQQHGNLIYCATTTMRVLLRKDHLNYDQPYVFWRHSMLLLDPTSH